MKNRNREKFDAPKYGAPKKKGPQDHGPGKAREDHRSGTRDDASADSRFTFASSRTGPGLIDVYLRAAMNPNWGYPVLESAPGPLHTEHTPEAVQAWKVARLYSPDGRTLQLGAVHRNTVHPVEGKAICNRDDASRSGNIWTFTITMGEPAQQTEQHSSPSLQCQCGFYAWKTADLARDYMETGINNLVLMQVELFGTVIQFERGYRAASQRVLGVTIPSVCAVLLCGARAECVDFPDVGRESRVIPLCATHRKPESLTTVGIADIANALGCEVTWSKP